MLGGKSVVFLSALVGLGGAIGVSYVVNPGYIFSPSIEKVMTSLYKEEWGEYEKITTNGSGDGAAATGGTGGGATTNGEGEREEKGKEHLRNWAERSLCPVFKKEIEGRMSKAKDYETTYKTFFEVIQTQCNLEKKQDDNKIPFSDYSLKSILYGLKDFGK